VVLCKNTLHSCTVNSEIPWLSGIVPDSSIPYPDYTNLAVSMVLNYSWPSRTVFNCSLATDSAVINSSRPFHTVP
jgi:hypothetical protein